MKHAITLLLILTACSADLQRRAVRAERALEGGSAAWEAHTDAVIEKCRAAQLEDDDARARCVEPTRTQDEAVGHALTAAVLALRAFWTGVSAGEDPKDLRHHLVNAAVAVADLPPEYFAGLAKLLR